MLHQFNASPSQKLQQKQTSNLCLLLTQSSLRLCRLGRLFDLHTSMCQFCLCMRCNTIFLFSFLQSFSRYCRLWTVMGRGALRAEMPFPSRALGLRNQWGINKKNTHASNRSRRRLGLFPGGLFIFPTKLRTASRVPRKKTRAPKINALGARRTTRGQHRPDSVLESLQWPACGHICF